MTKADLQEGGKGDAGRKAIDARTSIVLDADVLFVLASQDV